jgi:hypothetical protein
MSTWEDFDREAREVEKASKERAPECVQLLQDAVGLLADAFSVGDSSAASNAILTKMSLLSQNFATLKCAVDMALRGYYTQAMNLLRIIYENWIAFHYLSKYPGNANLWLRSSRNKRPPVHSEMLNKLDKDFNPLKGKMKNWYSTLCRFAHTDAVGVIPQIFTDFAPNETSIHFGSTYKDGLFRASTYAISLWTGVMLSDISQWIPNVNEWHKVKIGIEGRIMEFIDQENKKYGQTQHNRQTRAHKGRRKKPCRP